MRALILGGTGMLGKAVTSWWRRQSQPALALSHLQADITDPDRLIEIVEAYRPLLIVNCAAFTHVDACEDERERALEVNGRAVANVVAAAAHAEARLIHVSTDYVFDGQGQKPYREDAPTAPRSTYGESKLLGEQEASRYPRALIVRASWLFGDGGPNFVATMHRLIRDRKLPLRVVDDQIGCPTYTGYLARALWELAPLDIHGVLHYSNRDAVSWHGFAVEIARELDTTAEVVPVSTDEFPRPARRPAYSVLDVSRFEELVGRRVEPWISGLASYLDTLRKPS